MKCNNCGGTGNLYIGKCIWCGAKLMEVGVSEE